MKKFLLIVYPIIVAVIVLGVIFITGPKNKDESVSVKNTDGNKIDFTYAAGTMISKDDMTEDEMKLHDAKVIQYGLYNIKNVLQQDTWSKTNEELVTWYEYVEANLFLPKTQRPFKWLDSSLTAFERIGGMKSELLGEDNGFSFDVPVDVGTYEIHIYPSSKTKEPDTSPIGMLWTSLRSNIDNMIEATDNYIGMSFEERSANGENKDKIKELINEINQEIYTVTYRNPDYTNQYMCGRQPEPSRENILICIDNVQKLLPLAPLGEASTITLTELYINEMPQLFETMLEDYDNTRVEPNAKTMSHWTGLHNRLIQNWDSYFSLIEKLQKLYN